MPGSSVYSVPLPLPGCGLPVTSAPPLLTWTLKFEAVRVPPSSFTTCLTTLSLGFAVCPMSSLTIRQVFSSPCSSTTEPSVVQSPEKRAS